MQENIIVKGARENNLKNIDVSIPRDKLTVITGLSGSGKSSLAFDTIYAEGQRRYVESLSSYARMFLGQKEKPDVDYIDGLSPAISIDQKTTSQNPRSTVGTVTEIYDYLRLLWARVGTPHCPNCGKEIKQQTIDQIVDQVMALGEGTRIQVMAPVIRGKKGEYAKVFEDARKSGYVRVRVDGSMYDLSEEIKLEKNIKHSIEVVVDRLILKPDVVHRLSDSAETARGRRTAPDKRTASGRQTALYGQTAPAKQPCTAKSTKSVSAGGASGACASEILPFEHEIAVRNLGFRFADDGHELFRGLTLSIRKGERIGIRGASGAGKTTLFNLLLGLYEPTGGEITIDGTPLTAANRRAWQNRIGYVSQNLFIADGSFAANVALGVPDDEIDRGRVAEALEAARLGEFVAGLAKGMDTHVGECGCRLSGGERQRISIARALYKQAGVLLLDEATSALDIPTEERINRSLETLMRTRPELTVLVIAHRESTLSHCDRIIDLTQP